jgi:hypothetical protein
MAGSSGRNVTPKPIGHFQLYNRRAWGHGAQREISRRAITPTPHRGDSSSFDCYPGVQHQPGSGGYGRRALGVLALEHVPTQNQDNLCRPTHILSQEIETKCVLPHAGFRFAKVVNQRMLIDIEVAGDSRRDLVQRLPVGENLVADLHGSKVQPDVQIDWVASEQ